MVGRRRVAVAPYPAGMTRVLPSLRVPSWWGVIGAVVVLVAAGGMAQLDPCVVASTCDPGDPARLLDTLAMGVALIAFFDAVASGLLAVLAVPVWFTTLPAVSDLPWWWAGTAVVLVFGAAGLIGAVQPSPGAASGLLPVVAVPPPTAPFPFEGRAVPPAPPRLPAVRRWIGAAVAVPAALAAMWFVGLAVAQQRAGLVPPAGATEWAVPAAVLCALFAGLGVRVARRSNHVRRLFSAAVPVRELDVVPLDTSLLVMRAGSPGFAVEIPVAGSVDTEPGRGRLYGDPLPGVWCVAVVAGRSIVPTGPARAYPIGWALNTQAAADRATAEPDAAGARPAAVAGAAQLVTEARDVDGDAALRTAVYRAVHDVDADNGLAPVPEWRLAPEDRAPEPAAVRNHRGRGLRGLLVVAAVGWFPLLLSLLPGPPDRTWASWPHLVAWVASASGLVMWWEWRDSGPQVLAWNDGGFALVTGSTAPVRWRWAQVSGVARSGGAITVDIADAPVTVSALSARRRWWARGGQRSAEQLWAALADTRRRAAQDAADRPTVEPPELARRRLPAALLLLWAADTALVTAILWWTQ